ncbi:hypothetical protein D1007_58273 [Hordeum vulgare]|nr:hypothetical protein D1007_58273 [Hordeum vulgare]
MHHVVDTHVRGKVLLVVYTNELVPVETSIQTMEQLLGKDNYQVVDFDLEFTSGRARQDQKVAFAQLSVQHDIHVYHYHLATRSFERFARFINNPYYSFAAVDTTNDLKVINVSGLTSQNLVNIRDHYKIWASTNNRQNSLVDLTSAIIDPYYMKMKHESKKDKNAWHSAWDQRLDEEQVKYATKEAYTSYKMYMRIVDMRKCLRPSLDEGSSNREVAGGSQELDN